MKAPHTRPKPKVPALVTLTLIGALIFIGLVWLAFMITRPDTAQPNKAPGERSPLIVDRAELDKEASRLESIANETDNVNAAQVKMRGDITAGRQIIIEASSQSSNEPAIKQALTTVFEAAWNNELFVPTDVRVSIVSKDGQQFDGRSLGFSGRSVNPDELYERFGSPAANPDWKP